MTASAHKCPTLDLDQGDETWRRSSSSEQLEAKMTHSYFQHQSHSNLNRSSSLNRILDTPTGPACLSVCRFVHSRTGPPPKSKTQQPSQEQHIQRKPHLPEHVSLKPLRAGAEKICREGEGRCDEHRFAFEDECAGTLHYPVCYVYNAPVNTCH